MTRLNRTAAAKFLDENGLPIAPNTLAKKAVDGSGPPYQIWSGQATYDTKDLLEWASSKLGPKFRSTADRRMNHTPPERPSHVASVAEKEVVHASAREAALGT